MLYVYEQKITIGFFNIVPMYSSPHNDGATGDQIMTAAYIEHRPKSTDKNAATTHHAVVVNGKDESEHKTQKEAKEAACRAGYRPVHVARERHLQNRDNPDHFRVDPC